MNKYPKLIEIMNKINSEMNFQDLISMIIDSAKELIGVEGASLLLIDRETNELIFDIVISEKGEIIRDRRLKIGEGLAGHVAATGESVLISDVDGDDRFCQDIDRSSGFKTRDLIAVPVMVKSVRIGVLEAVNSMSPEGFVPNDLMMLQYLADAAAVAINNRELVVNLKNRVDELTCIYEIAQSIYFTLDIEVFLGKILHAVNRVIRAGRCSFVILDEKCEDVKYFVSTQEKKFSVDLDNSLMGHVIRTGDPMLVYNIDDDSRYQISMHRVGEYRSKSFLCVPMKLRDRVIGVLNVTDKPRGDIFDSFDLRVLSTIANQVAETYENVMLQKRDIEREIMEKDLAIAAEIQAMALSGIPEGIRGADIGAFSMPAHSVGGDFYEVSALAGGRFSIAVADVSGKGITAALFMNSVRNALRFESAQCCEPGELLARVNKWVYRESRSGMFCTFFYCLVDIDRREIRYASAGHNNQVCYSEQRDSFSMLQAGGRPLGILEESVFVERTISFDLGDILLLFTDGLVEKKAGSVFSIEDLHVIARKDRNRSASALAADVKETVLKETTAATRDDVTLIAVKFQ